MREKINVLFLHSQNFFGADSTVHAHLMRYLDRERFEVHLAGTRGDVWGMPPSLAKFQELPGVHLRPTDFAPGFHHRSLEEILRQFPAAATFPMDFVALRDYALRKRVRVIHGTDRPRDAVYALGLGKLTGAKSVVHVHVAWSHGYSTAAKLGVRHADAVFSISRFVTDTVLATGTPSERVYTILNCVDPSNWDSHIDGSGVRREFGIPPKPPLLASVSRLFGQKGQREPQPAFPLVPPRI